MPLASGGVTSAPRPSSLADVLDLILDKGLVVDAYVRVSALGIEVLTIDARVVIASVDTYLHYAEAVNRLDLSHTEVRGIHGMAQDVKESGAKGEVRGAIEGGKEALGLDDGDGDGDGEKRRVGASRRRGGDSS